MLSTNSDKEFDFLVCDILSALPARVIAWREHKRLMLIVGATAYLSAARLVLSFIS